jgi:hypothetical protein
MQTGLLSCLITLLAAHSLQSIGQNMITAHSLQSIGQNMITAHSLQSIGQNMITAHSLQSIGGVMVFIATCLLIYAIFKCWIAYSELLSIFCLFYGLLWIYGV